MHPFIYISLLLEPTNIDVNVHPTKHEVHFLHEEEIIEKIKECFESKLKGSNSTRIFYKQQKLPGVTAESDEQNRTNVSSTGKINPKDMIRTDSKSQKLDKFFLSQEKSAKIDLNESSCSSRTPTGVKLSSILSMRSEIENACSYLLRQTLKDMVFVGVVDVYYALFQFETKLYLCNTQKFR